MNNRRITISEGAEDVGISTGSCGKIVSNILYMKRMVAKFIPN